MQCQLFVQFYCTSNCNLHLRVQKLMFNISHFTLKILNFNVSQFYIWFISENVQCWICNYTMKWKAILLTLLWNCRGTEIGRISPPPIFQINHQILVHKNYLFIQFIFFVNKCFLIKKISSNLFMYAHIPWYNWGFNFLVSFVLIQRK